MSIIRRRKTTDRYSPRFSYNPQDLFADEPTGNFDHHTAEQCVFVLLELNKILNTSLLIVTHDLRLASKMNRIYQLEDNGPVFGR